ncbi:helix-turn-helix domain-containing protein [Pseudobacteriovorax antillogorgiicola]|uniref:helix-turn-helix domain-containing protein n=1 Tax=Pseudobacteriovorax antillogorgiicola TaxID=1513793 RepID=UPI0010526813|nr:helix-turn-helix domain-containing protein [Pseudobacteriovorax antillogorgiicola]TCS50622.1 helix-turn-helix protein [Pseudobacteriovorax antillogorgiicola]
MKVREELEQEGIKISIRKLCDWMDIPRSQIYREPKERVQYRLDSMLVARIREIIQKHPYFGLRRIHWKLNQSYPKRVNIKAVHRILSKSSNLCVLKPFFPFLTITTYS